VQSYEEEAADSLLVRSATGSSARRVLRALVGDDRPDVVRLASVVTTVVLWIGDVLIRDAVPLGAAVISVDDGVVTLLAIAAASGFADADAMARLARGVVSACAPAGARRIVLPASAVDDELVAFFRLVAADRAVDASEGHWVVDLSAP
jgi:hypothetical protein